MLAQDLGYYRSPTDKGSWVTPGGGGGWSFDTQYANFDPRSFAGAGLQEAWPEGSRSSFGEAWNPANNPGARSQFGAVGIEYLDSPGIGLWGLVSAASAGVSAYHGYKRNSSVGWAVAWGLLGGIFPIITPAVAFAQGFGDPKK